MNFNFHPNHLKQLLLKILKVKELKTNASNKYEQIQAYKNIYIQK